MGEVLNLRSKRELRDNFIVHTKFISSTPDQSCRLHEEKGWGIVQTTSQPHINIHALVEDVNSVTHRFPNIFSQHHNL
jgi:hypothetical protein